MAHRSLLADAQSVLIPPLLLLNPDPSFTFSSLYLHPPPLCLLFVLIGPHLKPPSASYPQHSSLSVSLSPQKINRYGLIYRSIASTFKSSGLHLSHTSHTHTYTHIHTHTYTLLRTVFLKFINTLIIGIITAQFHIPLCSTCCLPVPYEFISEGADGWCGRCLEGDRPLWLR